MLPTVLRQLFASEKAVASGALVVLATALAGLGKISFAEWQEYTIWCLGIYVGGKTVQGAASLLGAKRDAAPPAE